jgi:hypothetical protein
MIQPEQADDAPDDEYKAMRETLQLLAVDGIRVAQIDMTNSIQMLFNALLLYEQAGSMDAEVKQRLTEWMQTNIDIMQESIRLIEMLQTTPPTD